MRRLICIAAFALCLAVPVWAQRGGGHAGGGHAGGFSGGHGGGFSGGHAGFGGGGHISGGMRSGPTASRGFSHGPAFAQHNFSHSNFGNSAFHSHNHHNHGHNFVFRTFCNGFGCRNRFFYPYAYAGYYDPLWWDSGYSYDEDYERDRAVANEMNQQSLEEQRMLRQEESDGDQDVYSRSNSARRSDPPPASVNEQQGPAIMPATVLVYRDQHKQEVRNYAIVGQTLWSFAPQRTEKIPLADLDLSATAKANDDQGITFRVPATSEAQ
ncbi:MAG TPA: hypothetical protein VFE61_15770 [Candidatus Sulfotelmatobacter sp.]|nr:hypothetical protein [Candidatus Sulfotelmatobacter sp.]